MTKYNPYIFCNLDQSLDKLVEKERNMLQQCPSRRLSYTYLIEAHGKFYIGKRTCKKAGVLPHQDTGYLSSSGCQEFKGIPRKEKKKYILEVFLNGDEAYEHEIALHKEYNVKNNDLFWNKANQTSKAFSFAAKGEKHPMYGKKHTDKTKRKMSEAKIGKGSANKGKKASPETRKKLSQAHMGKPLSAEHRRSLSESLSGEKHPMYGKRHTDAAKRKISGEQRGKILGRNTPIMTIR